jgi:hypothetical protein
VPTFERKLIARNRISLEGGHIGISRREELVRRM